MAAQGGGLVSENPVTLTSAGQQVVGMFHQPMADGPVPAVLMLHGFTGSKHEIRRLFVQQARALARKGIATLRIDFRGCGDSAGEFHEMTVSGMCADARAAWDWLSRQPGIDPARMGLHGMSLGGMIATLTCGAGLPARALVLWAPVTNPRRLVASRTSPDSQRQLSTEGIADLNGWAVGRAFVMEMMGADPRAALLRVAAPMLFLHGDQDPTVPYEDTVAAMDELGRAGREARLSTLAGADHGFSSLPWIDRLLTESTGWFVDRL